MRINTMGMGRAATESLLRRGWQNAESAHGWPVYSATKMLPSRRQAVCAAIALVGGPHGAGAVPAIRNANDRTVAAFRARVSCGCSRELRPGATPARTIPRTDSFLRERLSR